MVRSKSSASPTRPATRATRGSTPPAKRTNKTKPTNATPPPTSWDERLISGLLTHKREVSGIALFLLGLVTLLALLDLTQTGWLGWWTGILRQLLGWGAFALCLLLAVILCN